MYIVVRQSSIIYFSSTHLTEHPVGPKPYVGKEEINGTQPLSSYRSVLALGVDVGNPLCSAYGSNPTLNKWSYGQSCFPRQAGGPVWSPCGSSSYPRGKDCTLLPPARGSQGQSPDLHPPGGFLRERVVTRFPRGQQDPQEQGPCFSPELEGTPGWDHLLSRTGLLPSMC